MPELDERCVILQRVGWGVTHPLYLAHVCQWNGSAWDSIARVSIKWGWRDSPESNTRPPRDEADLVELRAALERDGYGDGELVYLQTDHGLERISSTHTE